MGEQYQSAELDPLTKLVMSLQQRAAEAQPGVVTGLRKLLFGTHPTEGSPHPGFFDLAPGMKPLAMGLGSLPFVAAKLAKVKGKPGASQARPRIPSVDSEDRMEGPGLLAMEEALGIHNPMAREHKNAPPDYLDEWAKAYANYKMEKEGGGNFDPYSVGYLNLPPPLQRPPNAKREAMVDQLGVGRLRMPPKESDPEIIRQFETGRQQASQGHDRIPNRIIDDSYSSPAGILRPNIFVVPMEGSLGFPGLELKSEAYFPRTVNPPKRRAILNDLNSRGLWP